MKYLCAHPLFKWAWVGTWHEAPTNLTYPCVFVFERSLHVTPTPEQIAEYRRSTRIVERLGGHMNKREHEIAGELPPLSAREQLVATRDAIDGYLDAHPVPDVQPPVLKCEDVAKITAGIETEDAADHVATGKGPF